MEQHRDRATRLLRRLGWLLFAGGLLVVAGYVGYGMLTDADTSIVFALAFFGIYLGLGALLVSVLRQRLTERKTDKYTDVRL